MFRNLSGSPQNWASTSPISNLAIYRISETLVGVEAVLLEKVILAVAPMMGRFGLQLPALQGKYPLG